MALCGIFHLHSLVRTCFPYSPFALFSASTPCFRCRVMDVNIGIYFPPFPTPPNKHGAHNRFNLGIFQVDSISAFAEARRAARSPLENTDPLDCEEARRLPGAGLLVRPVACHMWGPARPSTPSLPGDGGLLNRKPKGFRPYSREAKI